MPVAAWSTVDAVGDAGAVGADEGLAVVGDHLGGVGHDLTAVRAGCAERVGDEVDSLSLVLSAVAPLGGGASAPALRRQVRWAGSAVGDSGTPRDRADTLAHRYPFHPSSLSE